MQDQDILGHIRKLVEEEQQLEGRHSNAAPDQKRVSAINTQLDQCWDLLRQRRARREFGANPDEAEVRPAATVEHYKQ